MAMTCATKSLLVIAHGHLNGEHNRSDNTAQGKQRIPYLPQQEEGVPTGGQGAPPKEEELVDVKALRLVHGPGRPGGHGVQYEDSGGAEAEEQPHVDISRRDPSEVGHGIYQVKVHGQQGQRVQLLVLGSPVPLKLRVPVVGEEADVDGG